MFFNQHLNLDLSERMLTNCIEDESPIGMSATFYPPCACDTGLAGREYCAISFHGIVDDACSPQPDHPDDPAQMCKTVDQGGHICENWSVRKWRNSGFHDWTTRNYMFEIPECASSEFLTQNIGEGELKRLLITKGPLASTRHINGEFHSMTLIGYRKDQGRTKWIFKDNSKDSEESLENENGFIELFFEHIIAIALPLGPFIPPSDTRYWPEEFTNQIQCVDADGDQYCNWGISDTKPTTCPSICREKKDCNDADPTIGPFVSETNLSCVRLSQDE